MCQTFSKSLITFPAVSPIQQLPAIRKKNCFWEKYDAVKHSWKRIFNLIHYSENNYDSIVSLVDCTVVHKCKVGKILDTFLRHTAIQYLHYYLETILFGILKFPSQSHDKDSHTPLSFRLLLLFCCNCNFIVEELEQLEVLKAYYTVD